MPDPRREVLTPDTIASPQAAAIEMAFWDRISSFWARYYDPSDKEALTGVYEAFLRALESDYVRLFQLDQCKSLTHHPIFTQRRWVRLDMHRYAELRAWLRFLLNTSQVKSATEATGLSQLTCGALDTNHARHWHLHFPWAVTDTSDAGKTINLGFPLVPSAITIWRMRDSTTGGLRSGGQLWPSEFTVVNNGTGIRLDASVLNERFEIDVAVDLSAPMYDGMVPQVQLVTSDGFVGPRSISIASGFHAGFPVHAMLVRNPPPGVTAGAQRTNRLDFATTRRLFPWGSPSDPVSPGVIIPTAGRLSLPTSVTLSPEDAVFVFGLVPGDFDTIHRHRRASDVLTAANATPAGTTTWSPPGAVIQPGIFGSVNFIGSEVKLFIRGRLIDPSNYDYDSNTNTFSFKVPFVFAVHESVPIEAVFQDESRSTLTLDGAFHLHFRCEGQTINPEEAFDVFDDAGEFDDELDPMGTFDTTGAVNRVSIPFPVDLLGVRVFAGTSVGGGLRFLQPGVDYFATVTDGQTVFNFNFNISGMNIEVRYREDSAIYVAGLSDIAGTSVAGTDFSSVGLLLDNNLQGLITGFETEYGQVKNWPALVEAARIVAAGGNPVFSLFYDEFPEYEGLPIDSPRVPTLTANQARNIESAGTRLIAIPFLTDHVLYPTVRLESGVDYAVVDGEIRSFGLNLAGPKYPGDLAPGVWWCPLLVLDEELLAKSFGVLVGDIRESSNRYREALAANLLLRFSGPAVNPTRNAAAVLLGSRMFSQDSKILSADYEVFGQTLTIEDEGGQRYEVYDFGPDEDLPEIGSPVYVGQSVRGVPVLLQSSIPFFVSWTGKSLIVNTDLVQVKEGDRVVLGTSIGRFSLVVRSVGIRSIPGGVQSTLTFTTTVNIPVDGGSSILIFRDVGGPYSPFNGRVSDVSPIRRVVYRTEFESFDIPEDAPRMYRPGSFVFRGMAVRPDLAVVYDHQERPDWHWETPANSRALWEGVVDTEQNTSMLPSGLPDLRFASVSVGASGYAIAEVLPTNPPVHRGQAARLVPDDRSVDPISFTVAGSDGPRVLLHPNISQDLSGQIEFMRPQPVTARPEFFEMPPLTPVESTLAHDQRAGSPVLALQSTSAFADQGQALVVTAEGSAIEIEYFSVDHASNLLREVTWPSDIPALQDASGVEHVDLPAGLVVRQSLVYVDRKMNPAFILAVKRRVINDTSTSGPTLVNLNPGNADQFYQLLRASTAVLEVASAQTEPLRFLLEDVAPASTSLVIQARHVIADAYEPQTTEAVAGDRALQFFPLTLTLSSPMGAIVGGILEVDGGTPAVTVSVAITDPNMQDPYTYEWSLRIIRGATPALSLTNAESSSCNLAGVAPGGRYRLSLLVTTANGITGEATVDVVVAP